MTHRKHAATAPSRRNAGAARLVGLLRGGGNGARSLRLLAALALAAAALLAATASSALAARGHVETSQVIGKPCTELVCGPEELKEPSAVAVNEATNRVYVLDQGNNRVLIFDGETHAQVGQFDGSLTEAGPWEFDSEAQVGALAVDNSCSLHVPPLSGAACTSFDPSNGDVYVADTTTAHRVIDKFTATGEFLGQIAEAGGQPLQQRPLRGVAVDPGGDLWVYSEITNASIYHFTNGATNTFVPPAILPNAFGGVALPGFAVDSAGNFYGRLLVNEPGVTKWNHSGQALIPEVGSGIRNAVSVDQASDASFLDTDTALTVFSPEGASQEHFDFGGGLIEGAGIGVDHASGFAYVADRAAGHVIVLGPTLPGPPSIETGNQGATDVSATEADLEAELNPRSEEGEPPTTYFFEYGPCTTPATCALSPYGLKSATGTLAPDFEAHPVFAHLSGLSPGTAYHFRLAAENSHNPGAPVTGAEGTFTTETVGPLVLPDSREWELVSAPEKHGALITPLYQYGVVQAAAGGSGITYLANAPTEAGPQGNANEVQVLSRRGGTAWSSRDIALPHLSATGKPLGDGPEYKFFDSELTASAVQPFGEFNSGFSAEASESTAFLHDLGEGCGAFCYRPLVTGKPGFENVPAGTVFGEAELCRPSAERTGANIVCGPRFLGATEDLSHVVLKANDAALTPGSEADIGLYEWSGGSLSAVSVLPGQSTAAGESALGGQESLAARGAISSDGERIVWTRKESLYLRDMALTETVQLDEAEESCGSCKSGRGVFQFASTDGSRVFFTDPHRLTEDSGANQNNEKGFNEPARSDLYECQIVVNAGEPSCELSDLTPKQGGEPADVQGGVLGASSNGTSVYFVAKGVLSATANARNEQAQPGKPNLYLSQNGTTSYIATLSGEDVHDWAPVLANQPTRASADGRYLALMSQAPLTGYDNRDRSSGQPVAEVYLYDAVTGQLRCASCEPSGARPIGVEYKKLDPRNGGLVGGFEIWQPTALVAANVAGWTGMTGASPMSRHQPRYLTDSGRLFFNTLDALIPQDSNATQDVYEYEPPGVGSCTESSATYSVRSGGCVSLISSGTSKEESAFLDASENGDDVFFLTEANLSPLDIDAARDVYDAHACSATSPCLPSPPPLAPACEGDACQPPAVPPTEPTLSTSVPSGPGNQLNCPKGKVKKSGKCVAKHHKKKHSKKNRKKAHKRANTNRRAGK